MSLVQPAIDAPQAADEAPPPSLRGIVLGALAVILFGFGGFFGWAFLAPLDSAVPANGFVVVESKRKSVSLLEPGILKELYVREGERVAAGQPLFRLDDVQASAQLRSLEMQRWAVVAKLARLRAEQEERDAIAPPADLVRAAASEPVVADLLANERRQFDDRRTAWRGQLAVQQKKIRQLEEQIAGLKSQVEATRQGLGFAERELVSITELYNKGLTTSTRLLGLKREQAQLQGDIGENAAKQAEAAQSIAQTELEMTSTTNQRRQEISKDRQEAEATAADLAERIRGAGDALAKKLVTAPEAGTVTDLRFFTAGSSIVAGQPVLDLVPLDNRMVIEANIRPEDVEHLHPGQNVNIRLTAYKQHKVPVLTGHLVYISADRQQDPKGETFFLARAEIDPAALDRVKGVQLAPGMPAELLIIGGERRAIDYFISPITDSLRRSLREE